MGRGQRGRRDIESGGRARVSRRLLVTRCRCGHWRRGAEARRRSSAVHDAIGRGRWRLGGCPVARGRRLALVEPCERATFVLVARRIEQVNRQDVAALVTIEAAREPTGAPLGAEGHIVAQPSLTLIGRAPIQRRLAQLLELEAFALLASRFLRTKRLATLTLVAGLSLDAITFDLLGALARAVVLAHRTPLLGPVTHQARGAVLRLRPPAKQQTLGRAPLGVGLETLARGELVAARRDPPRERHASSLHARREQGADRAGCQREQRSSAQSERACAARWPESRAGPG